MYELPEDSKLLFDGCRGIYIPQNFAEEIIRDCVSNVSDEQYEVLEAGPGREWYWETWQEVLDYAVITEPDGTEYTLYQDDDVWLVPANAVWRDPWEDAPPVDWDEHDRIAAESERIEAHRREQ